MTPIDFAQTILAPAAKLWPGDNSLPAHCLLLAIAGQESGWSTRLQQPVAYARGFWQCEAEAVSAVIAGQSGKLFAGFCGVLAVPASVADVFEAIAWNDALAFGLARLLLWPDPAPLPAVALAEEETAWAYYLRCWRPGKPARDRWSTVYQQAVEVYQGGGIT